MDRRAFLGWLTLGTLAAPLAPGRSKRGRYTESVISPFPLARRRRV